MTNKKNILVVTILLLLILLLSGCHNLVPKPTKGLIFGRVLIPSTCDKQCKDISGWVPVSDAEVSLRDANGVLHKVYTDNNGNFSFENLSVNSFTIVTALIEYADDTSTILKGVIPNAVTKDDNYDVGILTPESTALALVVEKLLEQGREIDLYRIKETRYFSTLLERIEEVLGGCSNVKDDSNTGTLIDKVADELFPHEGPDIEKVASINIITDPVDTGSLNNDTEVTVTLTTSTEGVTIYYTLDGTTPDAGSEKYTGPFKLTTTNPEGETITIKAIGIKPDSIDSNVASKKVIFKVKTYTVTFETDGGTGVLPLTNVVHNSTISAPTPPTKTGYDFDGWYKEGAHTNLWNFSTDTVTADITLYAKWTAQSNIAYKVEHYQQDVTGTTYTLADTDNLTGTTGETVTATPKTYTGFTENTTHPDRVPSGTVLADGSLVLKLYYDRNTYTVSFNSNGGSAVSPISGVRYGATIGAPAAPTRTGYDFDGWYKEGALTNLWNFATDTVTANTTLYAKWTAVQTAPEIANYTSGRTNTNVGSTTITVPAGTQNGDLMVLIFTINGGSAPAAPYGWTRLAPENNTGNDITQAIYYQKLTGGLSDFILNHGYNNNRRTSWILLCIPDGDIPKASAVATGQSRTPNPPSLAHGFGTGTNVLWIATAGWTRSNTVTGWPTNYNDNRYSVYASNDSGNSTAIATRTRTANTEDPGNFSLQQQTGWPTPQNPYWCAFTLAVKRQ